MILFFADEESSAGIRFRFVEFVLARGKRQALDDTVELLGFIGCRDCCDRAPDSYVSRLRERSKCEFDRRSSGTVSPAELRERIHFRSVLEAM